MRHSGSEPVPATSVQWQQKPPLQGVHEVSVLCQAEVTKGCERKEQTQPPAKGAIAKPSRAAKDSDLNFKATVGIWSRPHPRPDETKLNLHLGGSGAGWGVGWPALFEPINSP